MIDWKRMATEIISKHRMPRTTINTTAKSLPRYATLGCGRWLALEQHRIVGHVGSDAYGSVANEWDMAWFGCRAHDVWLSSPVRGEGLDVSGSALCFASGRNDTSCRTD